MKINKAALAAISLMFCVFLTGPVKAGIINWTLSDVTFVGGGGLSGTFSTDSTTGSLLSFDITSFGAINGLPYHYDSTSSIFNPANWPNGDFFSGNAGLIQSSGANQFIIGVSYTPYEFLPSFIDQRYLYLGFENSLTSYGVNLLRIFPFDCNCDPGFIDALTFSAEYPTQNSADTASNINLIATGSAISVATVPEPETFALLLGGMGLLAFVTRRRKRSSDPYFSRQM